MFFSVYYSEKNTILKGTKGTKRYCFAEIVNRKWKTRVEHLHSQAASARDILRDRSVERDKTSLFREITNRKWKTKVEYLTFASLTAASDCNISHSTALERNKTLLLRKIMNRKGKTKAECKYFTFHCFRQLFLSRTNCNF